MSYRIDDPTGRVVGELLSSMIEPPRLAVGDLVVQIVANELSQVADRYWAQINLIDTWIYVCRKMKINDSEGRIVQATVCDADLEEIPDAELQPLPPQRLPEKPNSLPSAPPRTALPQTLVLRSFVPPKETPALTGPQEALHSPCLPHGRPPCSPCAPFAPGAPGSPILCLGQSFSADRHNPATTDWRRPVASEGSFISPKAPKRFSAL